MSSYPTLQYANCTTLQLRLLPPLHYTALHLTTPHYALQHTILQYTKIHQITSHELHNTTTNRSYNCTTLITLHHIYNFTTLQYNYNTTLYPAAVGEVAVTIATSCSKHTVPTTFRSTSAFPTPCMYHNDSPLL